VEEKTMQHDEHVWVWRRQWHYLNAFLPYLIRPTVARSYDVTYQSEQEARADWNTLPPKYRTKRKLDDMLSRVSRTVG
jgi:hypothetical protein